MPFNRLCLPKIVDYPLALKELSEGHFYGHADGDLVEVVVGKLTDQPASSVKIDDAVEAGGILRGLQADRLHR